MILRAKKFARVEGGSMTIFGLFMFIICVMVGGLAVDIANAVRARTQLQVAADTAGHAALVWRYYHGVQKGKEKAIEIATANMPVGYFGTVLKNEDITFGIWDGDANTFTPSNESDNAVRVSTRRIAANKNAVGTYLLKLVGVTSWDLNTDVILEMYVPECLKEGYVAEDLIELQSDNLFKSGFCMHSNTGLVFANHNVFEDGVMISVPDPATDVSAMFEFNIGLEDALHRRQYALNIPQRIAAITAGVQDPNSDFYRSFVTSSVIKDVDANKQLDQSVVPPGSIYRVTCSDPRKAVRIAANSVIEKVVILSNCKFVVGADSILQDMTLITTNSEVDSISSAAMVQFGIDDNCAPGGSTQIVSSGGMSFTTHMSIYDSQLLAGDDVRFTSHADGMKGAQIISGGKINTNSHINMGFCGPNDNNFDIEYVRIVM